jgi:hypothetical protein
MPLGSGGGHPCYMSMTVSGLGIEQQVLTSAVATAASMAEPC